jgi:fatty-acyl-CoA synthase
MGKVDYARIWRYLKESNVTHYNGAPVVQNLLCHHPDAVRLPHPVKGFSGGNL